VYTDAMEPEPKTDPISRFAQLFAQASASIPKDPNAMVLATVDPDGRPSARVVLLKGFDAAGFVFYTNLESRKAAALQAHRFAALCFYWPSLDVQVRVEGSVARVADEEADLYFASRPRGSQLGAWASEQSRPLASRELLENRMIKLEQAYAGLEVPRPPYWSGFRLRPDRMEFWHGKPSRLHERILYRLEEDRWIPSLLNP
jgi:pyridoxamine 5'-phosphate oxidase